MPGRGKGGAKRHRKVLRDKIQGITKPAIRRLSGLVYESILGDRDPRCSDLHSACQEKDSYRSAQCDRIENKMQKLFFEIIPFLSHGICKIS